MESLEELYKKWLSLQPITREYENRLNQKFMLEFNYNSNHIEGNTLTYGQTELLLLFGKVSDPADMKELEEMKAHNVCLRMIKEEAISDRPMTEYFIKNLHRILLREDYSVKHEDNKGNAYTYTIHAGKYKTRPNSVRTITDEIFEYASPEETAALMGDLIQWYNDAEKVGTLNPIQLASIFHYRYIRIHPFEDGNGRIARLMMNFILLRHHYPMVIVKAESKKRYLDCLNQCDIKVGSVPSVGVNATVEQLGPFIKYMESCLIDSLKLCLKAAHGEYLDEEDLDKELALIDRKIKNKEMRQSRNILKNKDDVLFVLEYFFYPIANRLRHIISVIASKWFNNSCYSYSMTNFDGADPNFKPTTDGKITVEKIFRSYNLPESIIGIYDYPEELFNNICKMWFECRLYNPKMSILGQLNISEYFSIELYDEFFTVGNNRDIFKYGEKPSNSYIIEYCISLKRHILTSISNEIDKTHF